MSDPKKVISKIQNDIIIDFLEYLVKTEEILTPMLEHIKLFCEALHETDKDKMKIIEKIDKLNLLIETYEKGREQ